MRSLITGPARIPPGRNVVINGDFNIWQRNTSFASIANGTYTADRYKYSKVGGVTAIHTVSQSTDVPTVAQSNHLSNFSLKLAVTTSQASILTGHHIEILQAVEGFNWLALAQQSFIISFWVKSHKTGTFCLSCQNSGQDRSYVAEYTINVADTWEKKTIAVPASPSAGTWNYTTGAGLSINWTQACGATFQTTAGAWQSGNFFGTSNQVNNVDSTNDTFLLSQVQIELGGVATPFEIRSYQQEIMLCQRYYEKTYNDTVNPATATSAGALLWYATGNTGEWTWFFKFAKRAAPTCTVYSPNSGTSGKIFCPSVPADETAAIDTSFVGQNSAAYFSTAAAANVVCEAHLTADADL